MGSVLSVFQSESSESLETEAVSTSTVDHKLCQENIDMIISFMSRAANLGNITIVDIAKIINAFTLYRFEECSVDFSNAEIKYSGQISMGDIVDSHYNSYYKNSWVLGTGSSFICPFEIGDKFEMNVLSNDLQLVITHLSSYIRARSYDAPIDIHVNESPICVNLAPKSHGYITDKFVIDKKCLKIGRNVIQIAYANSSQGMANYWIKQFKIVEIPSD